MAHIIVDIEITQNLLPNEANMYTIIFSWQLENMLYLLGIYSLEWNDVFYEDLYRCCIMSMG